MIRKIFHSKFSEIILVYLALFIVDNIFKFNFITLSVNPYWAVLLFYAVRSNITTHIISLSSFTTVFFSSVYFQNIKFTFSNAVANSSVLAISTLIAMINETRIYRITSLEISLSEKEKEIENLKEEIQKQRIFIEELKETIFYEGEGISNLFLKLRELPVNDPQEFYQGFLEIISDFFDINKLSIYRLNRGFFRFIAGKGEPILGFSFRIEDSVVVKRAISEGFSSIRNLVEEAKPESLVGEPWAAVKIGDEEVYGVMVVEDIKPSKLNKTYQKYLMSMSAWLYSTMKKLESMQSEYIRQHKLEDGSYDEEYYKKEFARLKILKEKYSLPFSVLCICVLKDDIKEFLSNFRTDDVPFKFKEEKDRVCYKILLPMCNEKGKERIIERIKSRFEGVTLCEDI